MNEPSLIDGFPRLPAAWESLFEKAPCGYLLTDPKGNIQLVNGTLLEWLQYGREELVHTKRFQQLLPPGEQIYYETRHTAILKLQPQVNELNYTLIAKDGKRHPMLVNSARHLNDDGELIALQFAFFLFSERKKYEQELLEAKKRSEQAAAAKSNFLSIVSHEVRTPIHAILNSTEILIQDQFPKEQRELLEVIHHSSNNLLDFVNSVLNITKMEAGSIEVLREPFRLGQLLQQLAVIYRSLAYKKNIAFELQVAEDLPEVLLGDEGAIRQVLTNLIGNAIKFTQEGKVTLGVQRVETQGEMCTLRFELRDTGIGIVPEELSKIFEPFTQANQNIYQQFGGTGLGLSISKQLLRMLDSEMEVVSELGKGTTFAFELSMPISDAAPKQETAPGLSVDPEQFAHLNVLLVDDIYSNILIIRRYFEGWNIACAHVSDGQAAVAKVQEQDFDLVLLDINMPGMDGYATSKAIRSLAAEKFRRLPIVGLTAFELSEIAVKVRRAGMNDVLSKPFKPAQLYDTIARWTTARDEVEVGSAAEVTKAAANEPVFDPFTLEYVCELFDRDAAAIQDYLGSVLVELQESLEGFTMAKERRSMADYRSAAHNNSSKIGTFKLRLLKQIMADGETLLSEGRYASFEAHCGAIIRFFQRFIEWVQEKIDEGEGCCE